MSASVFNIGVSALQSYQGAIAITANNIANASTKGFQPAAAQFEQSSPAGNGVQLGNSSSATAPTPADASSASATDLAGEMVKLLEYKAGFKAAARVVETSDGMLGTLLDLRS